MSWHKLDGARGPRNDSFVSISASRRTDRRCLRITIRIGAALSKQLALSPGRRVHVEIGRNADRGLLRLSVATGNGPASRRIFKAPLDRAVKFELPAASLKATRPYPAERIKHWVKADGLYLALPWWACEKDNDATQAFPV